MKKTYILLFSLLSILSACQKDEEAIWKSDGAGALRLELPAVQSESEIPVIQTKGTFGLDANDFLIQIDKRENAGTYTKHVGFKSYTEMIEAGMPLILPVGDYRVTASSYDKSTTEKRVSEVPYFEEIQDFQIEEKTITSIPTLTCTFESIGVELRLSEQFKKKVELEPQNYSYVVNVTSGETTWKFDPITNIKPAYLLDICDKLVVKVKVTLDGKLYPERTYYVSNPKTGKVSIHEYYLITLDAGAEAETKGIQLTTKCIGE